MYSAAVKKPVWRNYAKLFESKVFTNITFKCRKRKFWIVIDNDNNYYIITLHAEKKTLINVFCHLSNVYLNKNSVTCFTVDSEVTPLPLPWGLHYPSPRPKRAIPPPLFWPTPFNPLNGFPIEWVSNSVLIIHNLDTWLIFIFYN